MRRTRIVGPIGAGLAAFAALGCRPAPRVAEIATGLGQGAEPNVITVANEALGEWDGRGALRIVVTYDTTRGTGPNRVQLSDQVEQAVKAAARPAVVAVVGPGGSRDALQVVPIYREAGLPQILPSATSGLLPSGGPWSFRLAPSDSAQGEFLGEFVARMLHGRAVTLFYIPDEYGRGLGSGISAALLRLGVRLIDRVPVPGGLPCVEADVRNPYDDMLVSTLRRGRPDVIVVAGAAWEAVCLARAAGPRLPGIRIVAGDAAEINLLQRRQAGPIADSIYLVAFWHPAQSDSTSREFTRRFRRVVGRLPTHGDAMWYDAAMVAATAIRSVGPSRKAVRDYLVSLGNTRPPYPGVTGPIAFTPGIRRPIVMTRLAGPETVLIAP